MKYIKIVFTAFLFGMIFAFFINMYSLYSENLKYHSQDNKSYNTVHASSSEKINLNLLGKGDDNEIIDNNEIEDYDEEGTENNDFEGTENNDFEFDEDETISYLFDNVSIKDESQKSVNIKSKRVLENMNKPIEISCEEPKNIKHKVYVNNSIVDSYEAEQPELFNNEYTDIEGILTFRGNNLRNKPSYGYAKIEIKQLNIEWSVSTGSSSWGGGAGWTGQPSIIKWPKEMKKFMNIDEKYKNDDNFTEVIYASLDGKVYFIDLQTGKQTRKPININNPIKGSLSIDPRGYPLLYVGQGINETGEIGYRIFSLIDGKLLYFLNGNDSKAYRGWGAFDGSALINRETDTLILGGENGLFYNIKLNANYNKENGQISINPEIIKYAYEINDNSYQGIENSAAVYKNLAYFADNGGGIQCVDLMNLNPAWTFDGTDDTDATLTVEVEEGVPYIYTANEVDKQGTSGTTYLRKLNGLNGKLIFEKPYKAMSLIGKNPVNGGVLATNIVGKNRLSNMVIFSIARYKKFNSGLMAALDKQSGEEIWTLEMPNYAWSSPVDVYDKDGKGYIIQCDSAGYIYLIDGESGTILNKIKVNNNIESSPAVFENTMVVAERFGKIYGIRIK